MENKYKELIKWLETSQKDKFKTPQANKSLKNSIVNSYDSFKSFQNSINKPHEKKQIIEEEKKISDVMETPPQKIKIKEYSTPGKLIGWPSYNWDIQFNREGLSEVFPKSEDKKWNIDFSGYKFNEEKMDEMGGKQFSEEDNIEDFINDIQEKYKDIKIFNKTF